VSISLVAIVLDGLAINGGFPIASSSTSNNAGSFLDPSLLDLFEDRRLRQNPNHSTTVNAASVSASSLIEMNSTSSLRVPSFSTTSSANADTTNPGFRLVHELSDYLNSSTTDDRKKVVSSLLELIDDDCLSLLQSRVDLEKKNRKKNNKDRDSTKKKKECNNGVKNGNNKDADSHSNEKGSIGSSSMEVISENTAGNQPQTSPSTGSRRTFAGFFTSKRGDKKPDKKTIKKDKERPPSSTNGRAEVATNDSSSLDTNKDSNSASEVRVDEEGYIIPPHLATDTSKKELDKFYSDSDTSDDEDSHKKPIRVVIKPINSTSTSSIKGTGSIQELKKTVQGLSLSALTTSRRQVTIGNDGTTPEEGPLKRSFSQSLYRGDKDFPPPTTCNFSTPVSQTENNGFSFNINTSNSAEDRYAALSSLFAESSTNSASGNSSTSQDQAFGLNSSISSFSASQVNTNNSLSKSVSSSAVMGPPLARPPSKRNQGGTGILRTPFPTIGSANSNVNDAFSSVYSTSMQRCKSYGSLTSSEMRMTPLSFPSMSSSRGPSPLTLGFNDTVPLAVAIQESISAKFRGTDESRCDVQMLGSLKIAFPSGIVQALMNNPAPSGLVFKITNSSKIEKIFPNHNILTIPSEGYQPGRDEYFFEVNPSGLVSHLKRSFEQNPTSRYFYLDILKYQLKSAPGAKSCPLQVVTHWKCEPNTTGLKIEYKYNPYALSSLEPLKNVVFGVHIDAPVTEIQGKPNPQWNSATRQASWSFSSISHASDDSGLGSLRAKFSVENGPSTPSPVSVQFSCVDASLSGINFELACTSYRVSLVKKQILASRFSSEADCNISYVGI